MATMKIIIFLGLFALALGFTLPDQENNLHDLSNYNEFVLSDGLPVDDTEILIRQARSPQGTVGGSLGYNDRQGGSAGLHYNHRLNKNYDVFGEVGRNFRHHDNSGMVGIRYNF